MSNIETAGIRRIVTIMEETFSEGGKVLDRPTRRAASVAVIENPFSGRYVEDLAPLMAIGRALGRILPERAVAALGVPADKVIVLGEKDSTKDEALEIRDQVVAHNWKKIIVVTSKQHTRRARLVINRRLQGTGTRIIMRASRYDRTDPVVWWDDRPTLRFTLFETQRLLGYWLGLAD